MTLDDELFRADLLKTNYLSHLPPKTGNFTGTTGSCYAAPRTISNLKENPAAGKKPMDLQAATAAQFQVKQPAAFTVDELPPSDQKLKGWRLLKRLHEAAIAAERDMYVDPPTGYTVFTSRYKGHFLSLLLFWQGCMKTRSGTES